MAEVCIDMLAFGGTQKSESKAFWSTMELIPRFSAARKPSVSW